MPYFTIEEPLVYPLNPCILLGEKEFGEILSNKTTTFVQNQPQPIPSTEKTLTVHNQLQVQEPRKLKYKLLQRTDYSNVTGASILNPSARL